MRWYRNEAWTGPTFMALMRDELKLFDWTAMAARGIVPARQVSLRGYEIVVFDGNLASGALPGWSAPMQYLAARKQ